MAKWLIEISKSGAEITDFRLCEVEEDEEDNFDEGILYTSLREVALTVLEIIEANSQIPVSSDERRTLTILASGRW